MTLLTFWRPFEDARTSQNIFTWLVRLGLWYVQEHAHSRLSQTDQQLNAGVSDQGWTFAPSPHHRHFPKSLSDVLNVREN